MHRTNDAINRASGEKNLKLEKAAINFRERSVLQVAKRDKNKLIQTKKRYIKKKG